MILEQDLVDLIKDLKGLGCSSVELLDDSALSARTAKREVERLAELNPQQKELQEAYFVEVLGIEGEVSDSSVSTELEVSCTAEQLPDCLSLLGAYLVRREAAEKREREDRRSGYQKWSFLGDFSGFIGASSKPEADYFGAQREYEVSLAMTEYPPEPYSLPADASAWERFKAWWD